MRTIRKSPIATMAVVFALTLVVSSQVEARKWTTRDGKHTTEAELVDFEGGKVILKRDDGKVVSVSLDRLSLSDHLYVKEALAALGREMPAGTKPVPMTEAPEPKAAATTPATTAPAPPTAADLAPASTWKEPPLTTSRGSTWQVRPNPAPIKFDLPADAKVAISLAGGSSNKLLLYPSAPVPFVCVGGSRDIPYTMYDIRSGERVGAMRDRIERASNPAVSPDGKRLAFHDYNDRGAIQIWSFDSGKSETRLVVGHDRFSVHALAFAGPDRLLASNIGHQEILVWDIRTQAILATIPCQSPPDEKSLAVSPGGAYVAIGNSKRLIEIYDTRNGFLAGTVEPKPKGQGFEQITALAFSQDGSELAAVYGQGRSVTFHCWKMADGEHTLYHQLRDVPFASSVIGCPLSWFADGSAWQLNGEVLIDRKQGGPIMKEEKKLLIYKYPNRYVDAQRMLEVSGERDSARLELVSIPTQKLAEASKLVASGGNSDDLELPKLTPIPQTAPRKQLLRPASWLYKPQTTKLPDGFSAAKPLQMDPGMAISASIEFARADVAIAAVGVHDPARADRKLGSKRVEGTNLINLYDLVTQKRIARFEVPFNTQLQDLSLDGKLGAFTIAGKQDRLDVFDLSNGQHVIGLRPYGSATNDEPFNFRIRWTCFAANNVLFTATNAGRLTAWSLPDGKPMYELDGGLSPAAVDGSGQVIATNSPGGLHLIDVSTGTSLGVLEKPKHLVSGAIAALAFRADGQRLAAVYREYDGLPTSYVVTWDLTNEGKLATELRYPMQAEGVKWVGADAILLVNVSKIEPPDAPTRLPDLSRVHQSALVDLTQNMVAWTYQHANGAPSLDSFADLHYYVIASDYNSPLILKSTPLPDADAKKYLEKQQLPRPLVGPGSALALDVEIKGTFPTSSDDKQSKAVKLREQVSEHLEELLAKQQIKRDDSSKLRLKVTMAERSESASIDLGSRVYGLTPRRTIRVTATTVVTIVQLVTSKDEVLWGAFDIVEPSELPATGAQVPKGVSPEDHVRQQQWDVATQWVRKLALPFPLHASEDFDGLGESTIGVDGTTAQRTPPPPAEPKPGSEDKQTQLPGLEASAATGIVVGIEFAKALRRFVLEAGEVALPD